MYAKCIKRILDVILSLVALVILSPVFLVVTILVRRSSPGPIFFTQKRVGLHKTHFEIWKFRTMFVDTPQDVPTHLLMNPGQYSTKVGKKLRKMSLDELPQLGQIFTGKMSIIGPRPALWNQYDLIEERDKYGANDVKPGLSGLAQISGRDQLSIEEKAALDGTYAQNLTFLMDVKCFFITGIKVLKGEGFVEEKYINPK